MVTKDAELPVKPKRPQTGYFLFLADFRARVKDVKLKEGEKVPSLAAKEWQKMSDIEKKPYSDKLVLEWKEYTEKMTEYKKQVSEKVILRPSKIKIFYAL